MDPPEVSLKALVLASPVCHMTGANINNNKKKWGVGTIVMDAAGVKWVSCTRAQQLERC